MRDQLFKDISDRLAEMVPELVHIDLDWAQTEIPELSDVVMFPCCLISFPTVGQWNTGMGRYQDGEVTVKIRVLDDMLASSATLQGDPAPDRASAITKLGFVNKVFAALQGFGSDYFSGLIRTSSEEGQRQDGLKEWMEFYTTRLKDLSAMPQRTTVNVVDFDIPK